MNKTFKMTTSYLLSVDFQPVKSVHPPSYFMRFSSQSPLGQKCQTKKNPKKPRPWGYARFQISSTAGPKGINLLSNAEGQDNVNRLAIVGKLQITFTPPSL
jgi:hypothetical protein